MFGPKEAEKITGIPMRRIQFYIESGLVNVESPGRGRRGREFSRDNLLELAVVSRLSSVGIDLATIKQIFASIRLQYPEMLLAGTYEVESPAGRFLSIADGQLKSLVGRREAIHVDDNGIPRTFAGGPAKILEIDVSQYEAVTIININNIYKKLLV